MSYLVNLEQFFGPMDLLLYLIEKNEMDIYDISLNTIIEQYIDYIYVAEEITIDNRTDFLMMASYLLNIKANHLLPRLRDDDNPEDDDIDLQAELLERIKIYKKFKDIALLLSGEEKQDIEQVFFRSHVIKPAAEDITSGNKWGLFKAYCSLIKKDVAVFQHILPIDDIKIEDKMQELLQILKSNSQPISFSSCIVSARSKREVLVFFLGLLELVRLRKVVVKQEHDYSDLIMIPV